MERMTFFDGRNEHHSVAARTQRSRISLSRHYADGPEGSHASAPAQDAHLVILQLHDQYPHDFWEGGKYERIPFSPEGALSIVDLRAEIVAEFQKPVDSLHLHIPRLALDDLAHDAGAPHVDTLAVEETFTLLDPLFRQLQPILKKAVEAPEDQPKAIMEHLLLAAANHVAVAYGGMRPLVVRRGALAEWQVRRAKELLEANLSHEVSLRDIAETCKLSLAHFSRAFKTSTGMTPHGWLQQCRIEKARQLLKTDEHSLAQIAISCGFADQSHFTRAFKRGAGMTPAMWRRAHGR